MKHARLSGEAREVAEALGGALGLPDQVRIDALCGDLVLEVPPALEGHIRVNGQRLSQGRRLLLHGDRVAYGGRRVVLDLEPAGPSGSTRTLARAALAADFLCDVVTGPVLVVLDGPAAGRRWPLAAGRHRLGRGLDADVVLGDPTVSRRHALVTVGAEGVHVRDLGSTHGTRLGRRRLRRRCRRLRHGDVLTLGAVSLKYLESPAPGPNEGSESTSVAHHFAITLGAALTLAGGIAVLAALLP